MGHRLVLTAGVSGSGKTYLGKRIAQLIPGSVFLDKDTMTRFFVEEVLTLLMKTDRDKAKTIFGPHDRDSEGYWIYVRPLEYKCLMKQALENLELGLNVVVSAPLIAEIQDGNWIRKLNRELNILGTSLRVVWIYASEDTTHRRMLARNADRDQWKLQHWDEYLTQISHKYDIPVSYIQIDNSDPPPAPLPEQLEAAIEYIVDDASYI